MGQMVKKYVLKKGRQGQSVLVLKQVYNDVTCSCSTHKVVVSLPSTQ